MAQEKKVDFASPDSKALIEALGACDNALEKCKLAHNDKDKIISNQDEQITVQRKRIEELERKESSILENKTLWFIVGSLFTGVVYKLTR